MTDRLRVDVCDGKYTVVQPEEGATYFLRYGEPWSKPDEQIRYVNMILAMAYEIDELRIALEATRQERDVARQLFDKEHAERELLSEALKRTQGNFARSLRSVAEREFGEELVRRVVNLDCQNERPR